MTKRIVSILGLVLAFSLAAQSHAGWTFIGYGDKDAVGNQGTDDNSELQNWIKVAKDDPDANVNLIGYGDFGDDFGGTLSLDPGTVNLTLHYGNYDFGEGKVNNVTLLYMCMDGGCDTFDVPTTKGLSNYRAYGTSVPEPGTLALLGAGLLGLGVLRRRRATA